MSWWDQLVSKATGGQYVAANGHDEAHEPYVRPPLSDGSEEFFGDFIPDQEQSWRPNKQVLIGLGITAGVLAGVGIAVWLKKSKRRKTWRDLLPKK